MYNYKEHIKNDIIDYIEENYTPDEIREHLEDPDRFNDDLYDDLFASDSVTGNASGSYTFSTYQAEENLSHNWDLLLEAADAFGEDPIVGDSWEHGAEWWDVTIRCYLLPYAITDALTELEEKYNVE